MTELVPIDAHAARSIAGRIRQGIRDYLATLALVKRAWDEEHYRILGYESWQEYCDGEFGSERLGLPTEHRNKALNDLRMSGMPIRAIAAVTGVPKSTVADEMGRLSEAGQLEQPETVRSLDGRDRPATRTSSPTGPDTAPADDLPKADRSGPISEGEESPAEGTVDTSDPAPATAGRERFGAAVIELRDALIALHTPDTEIGSAVESAVHDLAAMVQAIRAVLDQPEVTR